MKKIFILTCGLLVNASALLSQALPNGDFENWSVINYSDPTGFTTGNLRDIQRMGFSSVSKVTGQTGSAIRIETKVVGPNASESYVINTSDPCDDPPMWKGGVPYSQKPTAITGYYRYNLPGNDSALIIVIFRKNGQHVGDNIITFRGTGNQSTFAAFSFSLNCSVTPDSMIFAAASSNKISSSLPVNGSFLELDELTFTGATQAIPNGNFENWVVKGRDDLSGWQSQGGENGIIKSTDVQSGTYALKLTTVKEGCGNINPSAVTTGYFSENSGPRGGKPYTGIKDTLCGYFKYTPAGSDTAFISVSLTKNGNMTGGGNLFLKAAANYSYFEIPFTSFTAPDTMRIDIQSSRWNTSMANQGSMLFVDRVWLKSAPLLTGIFSIDTPMNLLLFPNPASDRLTIKYTGTDRISEAIIYTMQGQMLNADPLESAGGDFQINISSFSAGIYYLEISSGGKVSRSKFVKE